MDINSLNAEERRSKFNLHTIAELQMDKNRLLYLDAVNGKMTMTRGKTITFYELHDKFYWKPINAITT